MKFVISEPLGQAFWSDGGEIGYTPLRPDGTFDTEDGGIVEVWEDVKPQEKHRIMIALGVDPFAHARAFWSKIAREHDWYVEPFFVQVWVEPDGTIKDSLAFRDMEEDIIVYDYVVPEEED